MENINYDELINCLYYINNNPIGTIKAIIKKDNYYKVVVKKINNNDNVLLDLTEIELLKIYKDYKIRLERYEFLKERDINQLVHFTKIENVDSILENGLLSINLLEDLNIDYLYTDEFRYDSKLDCICNSITFPNYKMFYSKRLENPNQEWAIVTINKSILLHKLDTEFFVNNRGSFEYEFDDTIHSNNDDLIKMFTEENRDQFIPSNYTTNPQAEVLIKDNINPSYITGIETIRPNEKVKSLTNNAHVNYNQRSSLFNGRCDYARWQNGN